MRIIFDDFIQYSNAAEELKSPALADDIYITTQTIILDSVRTFNAIGIGNTSATSIKINGVEIPLGTRDKNGLYLLPAVQTTQSIEVELIGGERIGRLAVGMSISLGAAPAREPGFWSTATNRTTLSGQVIPGAGGVSGRHITVDFRYKFTDVIFDSIQAAFPSQISRGFPFFISFDDCPGWEKYPWKRLYAYSDEKWLFQSSVNRFLYSKKLKFTEAY